jgi:hypothetical protein
LIIVTFFIGSLIACDTGSGGGGGAGSDPTSAAYKSADNDGNVYELVITKNPAKAAYNPQNGDNYVLTITLAAGGTKKSSGTINTVSGLTFTLKKGDITFTVTVTVAGIIGTITAEAGIPLDDNGTLPAPSGALKPVGGGGNTVIGELAGTTWKITDNDWGITATLTFTSATKCTMSIDWLGMTETGTGTYKVEGNIITIIEDDPDEEPWTLEIINATTLKDGDDFIWTKVS